MRRLFLQGYLLLSAIIFMGVGCKKADRAKYEEVNPVDRTADLSLLADYALKNTPEHLHFAPGTEFSWCLFDAGKDDPLPRFTEEVLSKLRKKYTVYTSEADVPDDRKHMHRGRLIGYRDGFYFHVRAEVLNPTTIKVHYSDWEAGLASSAHYEVYEWTGKVWKIIEKEDLSVS